MHQKGIRNPVDFSVNFLFLVSIRYFGVVHLIPHKQYAR